MLKKKESDIYNLFNNNSLPTNPIFLDLSKLNDGPRGRSIAKTKRQTKNFNPNVIKGKCNFIHFSRKRQALMCLSCATFGQLHARHMPKRWIDGHQDFRQLTESSKKGKKIHTF